jgi:hypothetical protein
MIENVFKVLFHIKGLGFCPVAEYDKVVCVSGVGLLST